MASEIIITNVKLTLIGKEESGKTELAKRLANMDGFSNFYTPTFGAAFFSRKINNDRLNLQIWDTAGQEKFKNVLPIYTKNAFCLLYIIDLNDTSHTVDDHLQLLSTSLQKEEPEHIVIVGTKNDLLDTPTKKQNANDAVTNLQNEIQTKYHQANVSSTYTSAKNNELGEMLTQLTEFALEKRYKPIEDLIQQTRISTATRLAYARIYKVHDNSAMKTTDEKMKGIAELLRDYVGTSWLKKAYHFKRHHRGEALDVLRLIEKGEIKEPKEALNALKNIFVQKNADNQELNFNGSLARRIKFMTEDIENLDLVQNAGPNRSPHHF